MSSDTKSWDYPPCNKCKSNVFVSGSKNNNKDYYCQICDLHFDTDWKGAGYPIELRLEHKQTLRKLKEADRQHFPIWWLRENVDNFSRHTATLHKEGYIEKWGAKESPWVLTDEGKNVDVDDL